MHPRKLAHPNGGEGGVTAAKIEPVILRSFHLSLPANRSDPVTVTCASYGNNIVQGIAATTPSHDGRDVKKGNHETRDSKE